MFYDYLNKKKCYYYQLCSIFANKIICIMDIKARIEEVIGQRGLTKREVSERMGKFNQAFNSLITNPKWDTIEHVAEAIGITTAELLFGNDEVIKNSGQELKSEVSSSQNNNQNTSSFGLIICPYCGRGIKLCLEKG